MTPAPLDDPGAAIISDHSHVADPAWALCQRCALAEAAHEHSLTPYRPDSPRAGGASPGASR